MFVKQYIHRAITYASILNSGMLLFLVLSKMKEVGWVNFDIGKYIIPIFIFGLVILIGIGWIEMKIFKGFREESRISFNYTPQYVEMHKKINEIWDDLQKKRGGSN